MGIVRDMQSKLATLILGILSEEERGPYEITKMLENLKTKKWLPMADSTVYAVINGLRKKGLIEGRKEKQSNLPERTVYNITREGEYELEESITNFLTEESSIATEFDIGILLMNNLSKSEILYKLKKKLERLDNHQYEIRNQLLNFERDRNKVSFAALALVRHRFHIIEAEIKTVKELIKTLNLNQHNDSHSPFDMRLI
ncbi:hypothetical protein APF79_12215 [bacterium BRH_c32]|nr:MAG: hypothetical protein APF79_12215 [bacterium BRH_c32]